MFLPKSVGMTFLHNKFITFIPMALIDGKKFRKIIQKYGCLDEVLEEITYVIYKNYEVKEKVSFGRCLVEVLDFKKRRIMPLRQIRYFDLAFSFWLNPDCKSDNDEICIKVDFEAAEEISLEEYEKREEIVPMEETLRAAKKIINPIYIE